MFNLQTGIDFKKRQHTIGTQQKLYRACAAVTGTLANGLRGTGNLCFDFSTEKRRRGFFYQFLVAALQRAVAGTHHDYVALLVGDNLRFNMARAVEILFNITLPAPEGCQRFTDG
ncbi:Uncharacterised protein [Klebsiella pneumoniae]|nr:Uncharacterised protein [Klebsiella pneumoniae]SLY07575.1 Uncharacterised protein [Klebsiella pneumoniae]SYS97387.1 Uncharacterised protein [Klebsiella pneumoniae]VFZ85273.1 Uncharacterised protein [Klebsiella pneumoniae]VGB04126.1 Uncharacterised protein [Klebsiella pneumoniae]